MPTIRDTIDPTRERDVSDEEALDLERMGILLTGTRAKTPEGLRAAATRQSLQREADAFASEAAALPVPRPVATDAVDDAAGGAEDGNQDPGDDPVSTTDETPATPDSPQES